MRHLITNACVLTVNASDEVFSPGYVLIEGERIAAVGPMSACPHGAFDLTTDAEGGFIAPGLINLHEHDYMHMMKGIAEGLLLEPWSRQVSSRSREAMEGADFVAAMRIGALEMLRTGTTTALLHPARASLELDVDGPLPPNSDLGLRQVHGIAYQIRTPVLADHPFGPAEAAENLALLAERFSRGPGQMNLAATMIECNAHHTAAGRSSDELVISGHKAASDLGLRIASHVSGGTLSMAMGFLKYKRVTGRSDVEYLDRLGVLDDSWLLIHGIHFTDQDIAIVRDRGASVVYTPTSEAIRAGGIGPWVQMLGEGIVCALGTDGPAVDYSMDMVEQMKAVVLFQNLRHRSPTALSPREALRMGTINGARALGIESWLGSIEPGKRADLVLYRRERSSQRLATDPIAAFVMASNGTDARLVLVNGRPAYDDGRFTAGIDPALIVAEARERADAINTRSGLISRAEPVWPQNAA
ncbi:5-methylthioadenosine/S-adenosylhomocysteine deaminase [Devosia enhydra]|uniref:5-methylthioadenosine/S-adenosylhomocysteine deaminase n=1 Tax=Devosia enhydra TaxID=665118 RepID=A0A1K2HV44_9HYPH|nr:amidohydrolase family protein [Devosia enhydra]SFZ81548.1 5-methylthioadenosine/S-adenosylhomocysteine deaminase [Devosia enhydra]